MYVPKGTYSLRTLNISNQKPTESGGMPYATVRNGHSGPCILSNSLLRMILIKANPIFEFKNWGSISIVSKLID